MSTRIKLHISQRPDRDDPLIVVTVPLGSLLPPGAALVIEGVEDSETVQQIIRWMQNKPLDEIVAQPELQRIYTPLYEQHLASIDVIRQEAKDDGTVVFTHCGSGSFSLAEKPGDVTLSPVRIMDQGVCACFPAKPGPVTMINLIPHTNGYQCALLEGEALSTEMVFPGNPLRVRFTHGTGRIIDWIVGYNN